MAEFLTKSQYARRRGRCAGSVSYRLRSGKLTHPAIRADGSIDVELADRQLGLMLDTGKGRIPSGTPEVPAQQLPAPREPQPLTAAQRSQVQLMAARALNATISAERARRELNHERGRYSLADEVYAVFTRLLAEHIGDVETSLTDLAIDLDLKGEQLSLLRRWWRTRRERTAEAARNLRDTHPRYISDDPEAG